jgi:YVTN family beta-propeller protein
VWVAYGNNKRFGVVRIDTATNRVVKTIPTGRWPVGVAAGDNAVWVANRNDNTVTRVDATTDSVVASIPVGKKPLGLAVGGGAVWVANSGSKSVSRIDPETNAVTATIEVGKEPSTISIGENAVWVANFGGHSVSRIDPRTNIVVATIAVGGNPNSILARGSNVWVGNQWGIVVRIDATSNKEAGRTLLGSSLDGMAIAGKSLWIADYGRSALRRADIVTDALGEEVIEVGSHPMILGVGSDEKGAIWVSEVSRGSVARVVPQ